VDVTAKSADGPEHAPAGRRRIDDFEAAGIVVLKALIQIRFLAGTRPGWDRTSEANLDRIRLLANMCDNMPTTPRLRRTSAGRRDRRPMSWAWNTSGPEAQALILEWIGAEGCHWTPPPPIPPPRKGIARRSLRQRATVLIGWPVHPPKGRPQLPREARRLKAIDTDTVCALFEEAGEFNPKAGKHSLWLRAHLDPDTLHHLVPDPQSYSWPNSDGPHPIPWWDCRLLLTMRDGEQVKSSVPVTPGTFSALPENVPRHRQHRLFHAVRSLERDTGLWDRDHKPGCGAEHCGYIAD
jgi:hypothetical protein